MRSLISVIVPVYNTGKYLSKCIDSILEQTYTDLEIILVDDGSPDNAGQICDEYAGKDSRIIVIHKANGGVSSARNAALDIAKGDYIGFVDSDDYIAKTMYETLYTNIVRHNADIAVCSYYKVYDENSLVPDIAQQCEYIFNAQESVQKMLLGHPYQGQMCTRLFKKEILNNTKNDETVRTWEDMLFIYQLVDNIHTVHFTSEPLYYYVQRNNSAIHSLNQSAGSHNAACEIMLKDAQEKHPQLLPYVKYLIMNLNIFEVIWSILGTKNNGFDIERYKICRKNFKKAFNLKSFRLADGLVKKTGFILFYINIHLFIAVFNSKPVRNSLADRLFK